MLDLLLEFIRKKLVVTGNPDDRISSADMVDAVICWLKAERHGPKTRRAIAVPFAAISRTHREPQTGARFASMKSVGKVNYIGVKWSV